MTTPYIKLLGPDGAAKVRSARTAADAATWTPEVEGAPKNFILDARDFDSVRVTPVFLDGSGAIVNGNSVSIDPLIMIPDARSTTGGRIWRQLPSTGSVTDGAVAEIAACAHFCAFRITAVSLGTATSVDLVVTGGILRPRAGSR